MHIENAFLGPWKLHHECRLKKSALLQEDSTKPLCIYFNYMWNSWEKKNNKIHLHSVLQILQLLIKNQSKWLYQSYIVIKKDNFNILFFHLSLAAKYFTCLTYPLIHYAALRQMKSNGLCNFKSSSRSVGWCFRPVNRLAKLNVSNL